MRVLNLLELALSSVSTPDAEPHSANWRKPSVATWSLPQKEKLGTCEAPIKSLKWVSQTENGKSFGWVTFDQIPSIINWKRGEESVRSRRCSGFQTDGAGINCCATITDLWRTWRLYHVTFFYFIIFFTPLTSVLLRKVTYFTRSILFLPGNFTRELSREQKIGILSILYFTQVSRFTHNILRYLIMIARIGHTGYNFSKLNGCLAEISIRIGEVISNPLKLSFV